MKAKKTILMGAKLVSSDFQMERVDVTREKRIPAIAADLKGAQLRRSFSSKQALYVEDLVERDMAYRGQPVSVELVDQPISLEMPGIARKSGKLGEIIPVTINKTRKKLMAEVVGEGRVRIKR